MMEKQGCSTRNIPIYKEKTKWYEYDTENTRGYLDWYYCDENSDEFPIRNVSKRQKLEPHYEDQTFNQFAKCNAPLLNGSIRRKDSHIFFFTKYVGKNKKYHGQHVITGYYKIEEYIRVGNPKRNAIKSKDAKFVSISDAYTMKKLCGTQRANPKCYKKKLDEKTTRKLLDYFKDKENRIDDYITETRSMGHSKGKNCCKPC